MAGTQKKLSGFDHVNIAIMYIVGAYVDQINEHSDSDSDSDYDSDSDSVTLRLPRTTPTSGG